MPSCKVPARLVFAAEAFASFATRCLATGTQPLGLKVLQPGFRVGGSRHYFMSEVLVFRGGMSAKAYSEKSHDHDVVVT